MDWRKDRPCFGQICRNWTLSFCQQQTEVAARLPIPTTDDESSPYAVEDVDEDEEECYEHCHPESESEIMHQRPQKILWKIAVPFSLKMKLLSFWINAVVIWEFLDQWRWYLRKAFSLFGWLCFDPAALAAKLKASYWAHFHSGISTKKTFTPGLRLQAWQGGHLFHIFPPWPRELLLSTRIGL